MDQQREVARKSSDLQGDWSTVGLTREIPIGIEVAHTLDEVWEKFSKSTTAAVVWRRDPEIWSPVLEAFNSYYGKFPDMDIGSKPPGKWANLIADRFRSDGFSQAHPEAAKTIINDMDQITKFVSIVGVSDSVEAFASPDMPKTHRHHDYFKLIALVSYIGFGTGVEGQKRSVADKHGETTGDYQCQPNEVLFMKGAKGFGDKRYTAGSYSTPVHWGPDPEDPATAMKRRYTFFVGSRIRSGGFMPYERDYF